MRVTSDWVSLLRSGENFNYGNLQQYTFTIIFTENKGSVKKNPTANWFYMTFKL